MLNLFTFFVGNNLILLFRGGGGGGGGGVMEEEGVISYSHCNFYFDQFVYHVDMALSTSLSYSKTS